MPSPTVPVDVLSHPPERRGGGVSPLPAGLPGIHQLIGLALSSSDSSASRLTDKQALKAFSGLTEDQLRDIGVYRKLRRHGWDLFDRNFPSECKPGFDYFRLELGP